MTRPSTDPHDVPGLDLGRLGSWFAEAVPGAGHELTATVVTGGKSNLTYLVSDGARDWIVRRPPLGHVLATAHDMGREYRVITALRDTVVAVPRTYGFCADQTVVGAPFFVMERVPGTPYRTAEQLQELGAERTHVIATRLIDTLGALHQVDPATIGLGDFGRPAGYLIRQVARWKRQLDASHNRDLPAADELHELLASAVPAESAVGIVHGDFRLDNVLVDKEDELTAVLDWEMATIGDPVSDLALMLVYHRLGESGAATVATAASAPGFLSEAEIIDRYSAASGRDPGALGFHLGLAAYKLAAITEGVHFRYISGHTIGEGFEQLRDSVHFLLDTGLTAMKEYD